MTTPALQALSDLSRDRSARDGLETQLAQARQRLDEATRRAEQAVAKLATELQDVARLESMSMTRILSALRGERDVDLNRERAEADAAGYAAAEAEARREAAQRDVTSLIARINAYGDLEARRQQVLAERERELAADPASAEAAARLAELATLIGAGQAELVQLDEAAEAAGVARQALSAADSVLGNAGAWSTYDTFFGGGMISDMAKYHRLDQAAQLIRESDQALAHLATELADVGVGGVGGIRVDEMTRFFDVWFDNIFSDLAVRQRIREAAGKVDTALRGVLDVSSHLEARRAEVRASLTELAAEREGLLATPR